MSGIDGSALGRRVLASVPVRVADVGGWTDTWFGSPGQICSVAVGPGVHVEGQVVRRDGSGRGGAPVHLVAPSLDEDYGVGPSAEVGWVHPVPGRQPLLEHAVGAVLADTVVDPGVTIELRITSAVPPGASLGTSAAVLVGVLAALDAIVDPEAGNTTTPDDLARRAHEVETGRAGREAGVQDHWAAAHGGIGHLIVSPYPSVRWRAIVPPVGVAGALAARLVTVVVGSHDSSVVHGEVIHALLSCAGTSHDPARRALRDLVRLAGEAAEALGSGDLGAWANVLVRSTDAQAALHPGLVGRAHQAAIAAGRAAGAVGWKVNGAGGAGGSLTFLAASDRDPADLGSALAEADRSWRVVDLRPAPGAAITVLDS